MILMIIDFDDTGLRAFWGETPQDCWTQFINKHSDDFDHDELENLAYAADFYDDPTELGMGVVCKVERTILFI